MPQLRHLSTTFVNNWPQCPSRAWSSYQKRLEFGDDMEGTDNTRFGTIVHNTQERIHEAGMLEQIEELSDEYIMEIFDSEWQSANCYDFEMYTHGSDKIADFVRKSFTHRLGETIAVELMFVLEVETDRVWVVDGRNHRNKIVDEILERSNTPVSSEIDRIDRYVDPEGKIHVKVHDYKTNILPFTRDEIENSKQLGLYWIVARALYPEADTIECVYDMLRHGRFPVEFPQYFIDTLKRFLINLWKQINAAENPEEKLNKYCRWCEIRGNCTAYAVALRTEIPKVLTDTTDTDESIKALFNQYENLADIVKLAQERQREIREALGAKIVKDGFGEPLQVGDEEYYLMQNPRYEFDKNAVFRTLQEQKQLLLLPSMMSISKTAVERTLKANPTLKEKLDEHMKKNFVTPTLKRRKISGGTLKTQETESDA
jgi:hypothetical protein